MNRFLISTIFVLFCFVTFAPQQAQAAECTIIYGGGKIQCPEATTTLTPPASNPTQPVTFPTQTPTKGGLVVHPPVNVTTTPATGPEVFSLISLIPTATAGIWLRRKTKKV